MAVRAVPGYRDPAPVGLPPGPTVTACGIHVDGNHADSDPCRRGPRDDSDRIGDEDPSPQAFSNVAKSPRQHAPCRGHSHQCIQRASRRPATAPIDNCVHVYSRRIDRPSGANVGRTGCTPGIHGPAWRKSCPGANSGHLRNARVRQPRRPGPAPAGDLVTAATGSVTNTRHVHVRRRSEIATTASTRLRPPLSVHSPCQRWACHRLD